MIESKIRELLGNNFDEDRFKRWQQNVCEELDSIKEEIQDMQYNQKSPGTTKIHAGIIEMKIKAVSECF